MQDPTASSRPRPLRRLWRLLPSRGRRRALARAAGLIAPRPAQHGLAARSALGVDGRRMAQARLGLDTLAVALRGEGLPVP